MAELVKVDCQQCGKEYLGEEPKGCCSGRDCGCMGWPINGPFLCDSCMEQHFKNKCSQ